MKNHYKIISICVTLCIMLPLCASNGKVQTGLDSELRGAWVATLVNIDWPRSSSESDEVKCHEIDSIVNRFHQLGINAVFLQVRPSYGTLYPSKIEPYSRFYTNDTTTTVVDPLKYWIDQCHKNGIELHAWINPYRTLFSPTNEQVQNFLKTRTNPEWYIKYGKNLYMNPGLPQTRAYVLSLVKELVINYDIDGIHFDDYFYPYKVKGEVFDDASSYQMYGGKFLNKDDWKRNNVNCLIKEIHDYLTIQAPLVKFGVSPFGVWRNKKDDLQGSDTQAGITSYDDLFADVIYWSKQQWIDYVAPQLYWPIGFNVADYKVLAHWWNDHVPFGDIYIGQATYKFDPNSKLKQWKSSNELKKQIELNRGLPHIKGNIFYNTSSIMNNRLDIMGLTQELYAKDAMIPTMAWKKQTFETPQYEQERYKLYTPILGHLVYQPDQGILLKWVIERNPRSFIITRERVNRKGRRKGKEEIIAMPTGEEMNYLDAGVKKGKYYKYRMVAVGKNSVYSSIVTGEVVRAK